MVSQNFRDAFVSHIYYSLRKVISGDPYVWVSGSNEDQYGKYSTSDRVLKWLLNEKISYEAHEHIYARIPLRITHLPSVDMIVPLVNLKTNSIPGIATFLACIPYPVPETYVLRSMMFGGNKLVPYRLTVDEKVGVRRIIKEEMIHCDAIKKINRNSEVCKKLSGNMSCPINVGLHTYRNSTLSTLYPMGMFYIVPYRGYSFIVSRDAGVENMMRANFPFYHLVKRISALEYVAGYITHYPQIGERIGKMLLNLDTSLLIMPKIKEIDMELGELEEEGWEEEDGEQEGWEMEDMEQEGELEEWQREEWEEEPDEEEFEDWD